MAPTQKLTHFMKVVTSTSPISRLVDESLPNVTGNCGGNFVTHMNSSQGVGALWYTKNGNGLGDAGNGGMPYGGITFNASHSSPTYQNNAHVRPLSITTAFLIKY